MDNTKWQIEEIKHRCLVLTGVKLQDYLAKELLEEVKKDTSSNPQVHDKIIKDFGEDIGIERHKSLFI